MSATDSPSDPSDRSRILRRSSEELRQHSRTLRQQAHRLTENSREFRNRLHSFLNPPPPTTQPDTMLGCAEHRWVAKHYPRITLVCKYLGLTLLILGFISQWIGVACAG